MSIADTTDSRFDEYPNGYPYTGTVSKKGKEPDSGIGKSGTGNSAVDESSGADSAKPMDHIALHVKQQVQAEGRRRYVRHGGTVCSRCLTEPPRKHDRYCADCRNAYRRDLRKGRQ